MKQKLKEVLTVNTVLAAVLVLLAVAAFAGPSAVSVFSGDESAIYNIETEEKVVAFMVNVYWGTEYVQPYLDLFKQEGIKVTFFLGGIWAKDNAQLIKNMQQDGHEIGNHGYNHKLPTRISSDETRKEISTTDTIITEITGVKPKLYAPPAGDFNKDTLKIARSLGYKTIMWSIDTIDWRDKDTQKIMNRVMKNLKPGAFVLMHPTANTLEALKSMISQIKEQGYQFKTVSEMLEI
ncbi:MAG TPA: polysaccharide deacetylase family protein [Firmicutes bacterium]|nr:polysaccharide deacetylase family protein [Bacillota bacterium]